MTPLLITPAMVRAARQRMLRRFVDAALAGPDVPKARPWYHRRIAAWLEENPQLGAEELSERAGCNLGTAQAALAYWQTQRREREQANTGRGRAPYA